MVPFLLPDLQCIPIALLARIVPLLVCRHPLDFALVAIIVRSDLPILLSLIARLGTRALVEVYLRPFALPVTIVQLVSSMQFKLERMNTRHRRDILLLSPALRDTIVLLALPPQLKTCVLHRAQLARHYQCAKFALVLTLCTVDSALRTARVATPALLACVTRRS
jgi:hypothetical protein